MNPELLPLCSFYLEGQCSNDHCNFRHEHVSGNVKIGGRFPMAFLSVATSVPGIARRDPTVPTSISIHVRKGLDDDADTKTSQSVKQENVSSFLPSFIKLGSKLLVVCHKHSTSS